jgi:uncharacterized protein (TIGR02246 family)
MKKLIAAASLLLLFAAPLFAQDQTTTPVADTAAPPADAPAPAAAPAPMAKKAGGDEEGVKKHFQEASDAWNAGDAKAMAALYTPDSSFISPMGDEGHGRKEIQKIFEDVFAGPMKGTQLTFDDFTIRFYPQPNIALVDCTGTLTGMKKPDGTDAGPFKAHHFCIIVNRTGKKWQTLVLRGYSFLTMPGSTAAADTADVAAPADSTTPSAKAADDTTDQATPSK